MKIFQFIKRINPVVRFGDRSEFDLVKDSEQMTREEISGLFESLNPWFLEPGFKADPNMEEGHRVYYIPLSQDDIGIEGEFGYVCYVRKDATAKTYQFVTFEEGRKRLDAHEAREHQAWVDDCNNGYDGEA